MKTENDFEQKYTYSRNIKSTVLDPNDQAGMLETFGEDIDLVLQVNNSTPKRVWTMIDGDNGMYLVAGFHFVNRVYYVVTNEEWQDSDEEYVFQEYEE